MKATTKSSNIDVLLRNSRSESDKTVFGRSEGSEKSTSLFCQNGKWTKIISAVDGQLIPPSLVPCLKQDNNSYLGSILGITPTCWLQIRRCYTN